MMNNNLFKKYNYIFCLLLYLPNPLNPKLNNRQAMPKWKFKLRQQQTWLLFTFFVYFSSS